MCLGAVHIDLNLEVRISQFLSPDCYISIWLKILG